MTWRRVDHPRGRRLTRSVAYFSSKCFRGSEHRGIWLGSSCFRSVSKSLNCVASRYSKAGARRSVHPLHALEQSVNKSGLNAPDVTGDAALHFLLSVERFQTDAQVLPNLVNQVQPAIMREVICVRSLGNFVVQVHVAVRGG